MFGTQFIIEELIYIPMGTHNPMFNRPYQINVTENAIGTLQDRMCEMNSVIVTPAMLTDLTGDMLQSSSVAYNTRIDTSWVSQRRFIFLLKVRSVEPGGIEILSYIQGYTEYDGISDQGNIDLNLNHVINNVIETTNYVTRTPMGVSQTEKLYRIYNVMGSDGVSEYYTQRPTDIMQTIEATERYNSYQMSEMDQFQLASSTISPYNNKTVGSLTDNSVGSEFLSKTLSSGILAHKSRDIVVGSFEVNDQSSTDTTLPEPSISDNRFIKALSVGKGQMATSALFTFSQLQQFDNTIYDRFKVINLTKDYVDVNMLNTPDVGEFWKGQDPVTVKAYSLLESSVAMAVKYGFSKLYFVASNMMNPTAAMTVYITYFQSFMKIDDAGFNSLLEIFKEKFSTDIFMSETSAGRIPLHMECYVDLLGTSKVLLEYAGYPSTWYTVPTTANSAFSSVVTPDGNALSTLADNFGSLTQALTSGPNGPQNFDPYNY